MVFERTHPTHYPREDPPGAPPLAAARLLAAGLATVLAGALLLAARCHRLEVVGDSMLPSFEPGDRLLAVEGLRIRPGHVVAVTDPRDSRRLLVKRVRRAYGGVLEVRGDNESASTDSREFGPVRRSEVRGRVVYRYSPPERAGRPPY